MTTEKFPSPSILSVLFSAQSHLSLKDVKEQGCSNTHYLTASILPIRLLEHFWNYKPNVGNLTQNLVANIQNKLAEEKREPVIRLFTDGLADLLKPLRVHQQQPVVGSVDTKGDGSGADIVISVIGHPIACIEFGRSVSYSVDDEYPQLAGYVNSLFREKLQSKALLTPILGIIMIDLKQVRIILFGWDIEKKPNSKSKEGDKGVIPEILLYNGEFENPTLGLEQVVSLVQFYANMIKTYYEEKPDWLKFKHTTAVCIDEASKYVYKCYDYRSSPGKDRSRVQWQGTPYYYTAIQSKLNVVELSPCHANEFHTPAAAEPPTAIVDNPAAVVAVHNNLVFDENEQKLRLIRYDYIDGSHIPTVTDQLSDIFEQLVELHSQGIVHGDIRLSNMIFYTVDGDDTTSSSSSTGASASYSIADLSRVLDLITTHHILDDISPYVTVDEGIIDHINASIAEVDAQFNVAINVVAWVHAAIRDVITMLWNPLALYYNRNKQLLSEGVVKKGQKRKFADLQQDNASIPLPGKSTGSNASDVLENGKQYHGQLIDFDFAGKDGEHTYPPGYNRDIDDGFRDVDSKAGVKMLKQHDLFAFTMICTRFWSVDEDWRDLVACKWYDAHVQIIRNVFEKVKGIPTDVFWDRCNINNTFLRTGSPNTKAGPSINPLSKEFAGEEQEAEFNL